MKRSVLRLAINVLITVVTIAVNVLANALPLNGQTTGAISDRFEVYFVPAGYVFSIWGLIYLALLAFTVLQALPAQWENPHLARIGYLYMVTGLANSAWIFLWHYELFGLTLVAMLILLAALIAIYLRLDIGRTHVPTRERWLVHIPFSIYLGWITVATIANVTAVLAYVQWSGWGFSPELWAIILLLAGAAIAVLVAYTRRDLAYVLVIIWAFVGIGVKHADTLSVALPAILLALVLAAVMAYALGRRPCPAQPV